MFAGGTYACYRGNYTGASSHRKWNDSRPVIAMPDPIGQCTGCTSLSPLKLRVFIISHVPRSLFPAATSELCSKNGPGVLPYLWTWIVEVSEFVLGVVWSGQAMPRTRASAWAAATPSATSPAPRRAVPIVARLTSRSNGFTTTLRSIRSTRPRSWYSTEMWMRMLTHAQVGLVCRS